MIIDVEQGSKEWIDLRRTKITATDSAVILGLNPWVSPGRPWREKLGLIDPEPENERMREGQKNEKIARDNFNSFNNYHYHPKVIISDEYPFMMASMDGLTGNGKKGMEIKCGEKSFQQAKKGIIPAYYQCQMQKQMLVCGLNEIFYLCYFENKDIMIVVKRDDIFINKLIPKEKYYYDCLINLREPDLNECTIGVI